MNLGNSEAAPLLAKRLPKPAQVLRQQFLQFIGMQMIRMLEDEP